ncbi:MAG: LPXTG cell wall anchor domain-containing protein [Bariatricus sp.]
MKKRVLKKMMAALLSLSLAFSAIPLSAIAEDAQDTAEAPAVKENVFAKTGTTFGINKLYSTGLSLCGTVLVKVANATGDEDFKKVASMLNTWIFGGSSTGQTLAEIQALCNEILNEVKIIDQHLTDYNSEIEQTLANSDYTSAKNALDQQWFRDVEIFEDSNNVGNALKAYMAYMEKAKAYNEGTIDIDEVDASKEKLYKAFCDVYESKEHAFGSETEEEIREIIFGDGTIDGVFETTIRNMTNALAKEKNYADAAAQFAYKAYGFSDDQYNYIITSIDKQFMEIVTLELMYEEFLSQRGEYFEEKYDDDDAIWNSYKRWADDLNILNEEVAKAMNVMLDREVVVSESAAGSIRLKLEEFVKSGDFATVNLKNEDYTSEFTSDDYKAEQTIIDAYNLENGDASGLLDDVSSSSNVTGSYMKFNRIAVPVQKTEANPSGMDIYYIFDTSQNGNSSWTSGDPVPENLRLINMDHKEDFAASKDIHVPSCDFFNLTRGSYSDGLQNFSCAVNSADCHSLFATQVFSALGSIPANYLQEYLLQADDAKTYFVFPQYDMSLGGAFGTDYPIFYLADTKSQHPGTDLEITQLNASDIQPDREDGLYDTTAYSVILKQDRESDGDGYYKTKIDTAVAGSGIAEIALLSEDGTTTSEAVTVSAGQEVTLKFKIGERTTFESLTLQRHNDYDNPTKVTSEETILKKEQINNLIPDADGYFTYTYPAPYSNATFVLNTCEGYKVYTEGTNQIFDDAITLDSYSNVFKEGETVVFYVRDNVKSVGYYEGDTYKEIQLKTNYEGDRKGSFVMPGHDITLYYEALCVDHPYENGFCMTCGEYQPADYNKSTGNYEIGNGGQMFWFASLVNGDDEHAWIEEARLDVHGTLVSDISLKNPADEEYEWKPIGEFRGCFDGQGHTISDYKITKVDADTGFFQTLVTAPEVSEKSEKATLKNFTLKGNVITTKSTASAVGGVVGTASGGVIERVNSEVNIASGVLYSAGGIVGQINAQTSIQECTYSGHIALDMNFYGVGGIAGVVNHDDSYSGSTIIKNCANYGEIDFYQVESMGGAGNSGGITGIINMSGKDIVLSDCYNYGSVVTRDQSYYGAISGTCHVKKDGIENCYYLDTIGSKPFVGDADIVNDGTLALAKTEAQFKSGEETYLLNREVTDGTQVWYQNIDNGKTPDDYPVLDNTHGTVYRLSDGTYSNYNTEPEKETYEIYTFEDFKKIPEIVKKNNRADFKLMNTIFGNGETLTESIGSAESPYNGTFDGQGYYVYRFDMKPTEGDAALFDTIGSMGTVKNLGIFFQTVEGEKAAGIALTNYGLIDECISGSNLSGSFVDKLSGETLPLSETTTFVKGKSMAGGVVVENKGVIRNTANYAEATAASSDGIAGGVAAINSGTIENCLSMGKLKAGENGIAGGITGTLTGNGAIHIAYCASASIEGKTVGAICGQNDVAVARSDEGAMSDTYYLNTLSGGEGQGTAKEKAEMRSDAFKDELNTLTEGKEGLCSWTRSDSKNSGYPKILSSLVVETELTIASKGLTVKGLMHKDTQLQMTELDKKNEVYQAFKKYAENSDKQILYCGEPTLVYEDGQPAAYEEILKVKLELSKYRGKDYKVLVYRNDKVEEVAINQQMIASKEVEELIPFAVLTKKSILSQVVKTGDTSNLFLWVGILIAAGAVSAGILFWRRKKAN